MAYKILIMGLPGSGKTTLARTITNELAKSSTVLWLNADEVRHKYHDWDFTNSGRLRQAQRFYNMAEESICGYVVCDFVAPMPASRGIYAPDYTIWMNTITRSRYEDTNQLFLDPIRWDYRITDFSDMDAHVTNIMRSLSSL